MMFFSEREPPADQMQRSSFYVTFKLLVIPVVTGMIITKELQCVPTSLYPCTLSVKVIQHGRDRLLYIMYSIS